MFDTLASYVPPARRLLAASFNAELEGNRSFSFLRLGDGELRFMLRMQEGNHEAWAPRRELSCENAIGSPAISPLQYLRLRISFERATVVDHYGALPFNSEHLSQLQWDRQDRTRDYSSGPYGLIIDWLVVFGKQYFLTHRCLFCGAEADILAQLIMDPAYRFLAKELIPDAPQLFFHQPYRNGSFISEDLDIIKEQLCREISMTGADTVFLSLGGGAKILAYELAKEMDIRVIDFGSAIRSLTYSGSDGYSGSRSPHHVHLLRVPFALYMSALLAARPHLSSEMILAKAHAQLCLEIQKHIPLRSQASDVHDSRNVDFSRECRVAFLEGYSVYRRKFRPLARSSPLARSQANEFTYWRRKKGLGWDGWLFIRLIRAKQLFRRSPIAVAIAL